MVNSVYCYGNTSEMNNVAQKIRNISAEQVIQVFNKYVVTDNDMWCAVAGPESEAAMEEILNK